MRLFSHAFLAGILCATTCGASLAEAVDQQRLNDAETSTDWLSHGHSYSEQRFSSLRQINRNTLSGLSLAWWTQFDTDRGQEATPLEADGVIYTTTAWSKVFAVDARTGNQIWKFDPHVPGGRASDACCDVVNRGAALWQGKVFVGTLDGRLIALNARTGQKIWSVQTTDPTRPYTITGAPRVVKGKVLIGNGGAEYGVRGYLSAYDADTGNLAWRFYTTPNPDGKPDNAASDEALAKKANATWFGDVWKQSGGGGTPWDGITYDPVTDLVYIGTGNGSPWNHFIRSQGKGDNLFLSSIVAVRPDTGAYVWHYQTTPGESWDYTAAQQIIVADLVLQGRKRHVLMQAPKNGFFYVLDAFTGELLSGDKYSPTVDWATGIDLKTGRPMERAGIRWGAGTPSHQTPGSSGAHSWKAMAFNPDEGLVYIPVLESRGNYSVTNPENFRQITGAWNVGMGVQGVAPRDQNVPGAVQRAVQNAHSPAPSNLPPDVPRGVLTAWDPVARHVRWRVEHTEPDWGLGGVLTTAGGLVFQGVRHDLIAYDAHSGTEVWRYGLGASAIAPPISYALDGVQYIAIMVGNGGGNGEGASNGTDVRVPGRLLAFRLGGTATLARYSTRNRAFVDFTAAEASDGDPAAGGIYFGRYCTVCHQANFIYPNLRQSYAPLSKSRFQAVVHDGAMQSTGMASFSRFLDPQQVEAIRAYLLAKYSADPGRPSPSSHN